MLLGILSRVRSQSDEEAPLPDSGIVAGSVTDALGLNADDDVLLDGVGLPTFVLDEQDHIAAWSASVESLAGASAADVLGRHDLGEMFYDNAAARVLVGQVFGNSRDVALLDDVKLDDPDWLLYIAEETFAGVNGDDCHARCIAMPLYEGDELVGVFQTVRNHMTGAERHREVAALVSKVESTLTQLSQGSLDAWAMINDSGAVDDQLYLVIGAVNKTARSLLTLMSNVEDEIETATVAVTRAASAADAIVENVGEQRDLLDKGMIQMQQFNATMEGVTATTDEVDTAAIEARQVAAEDCEINSEAREATENVVIMGDEPADRVTGLGGRMDDIEAVVEVIFEVVEQTNLLAFSVSIEAARAGEDGDGLAVVAEEVKSLTDETRQYTEDITVQIEDTQSQTDGAVRAATESNDRIEHADGRISEMLTVLEEIAASIDTVADGVVKVSRATSEQTEAAEELIATIEDVRNRTIETGDAVDSVVAVIDESTQVLSSLTTEVEGPIGSRSA